MMSCKASMSVCAVAAMTVAMLATPGHAAKKEEILSAQQASREAVTTDVRTHDGVVSGKVVNKSGDTLRNVKLMIDHAWLWKHERRPGTNDPSRTNFYSVPQAIPPHGTVAFEYRTNPPLPHRSDGRFNTTVKVMGFNEVGAQQASR